MLHRPITTLRDESIDSSDEPSQPIQFMARLGEGGMFFPVLARSSFDVTQRLLEHAGGRRIEVLTAAQWVAKYHGAEAAAQRNDARALDQQIRDDFRARHLAGETLL